MTKAITYLDISLTNVNDSIVSAFLNYNFYLSLNTTNFVQDCTGSNFIYVPTDSYTS